VSVEQELKLEEGASQLSAMFDGELTAAECELLSRRLGRDEQLRGRWARYALIGATLRSESVNRVSRDFSRRVGVAIAAGDAAHARSLARGGDRSLRAGWYRRLAAGGALAAAVAAAAIFVLRGQIAVQDEALVAFTPSAQRIGLSAGGNSAGVYALPAETLAIAGVASERVSRAPRDYVVPPVSDGGAAAPANLANYVVAHSEYSSPLVRGGLISRLVSTSVGAAAGANVGQDDVEVIIARDDTR
jgi:negative regulator of sigma E activity